MSKFNHLLLRMTQGRICTAITAPSPMPIAMSTNCSSALHAQRRPILTARRPGRQAMGGRPRSCGAGAAQQQPVAAVLRDVQAAVCQAGMSCLAALLLFVEPASAAESLAGPARVVDGDTLEVAGTRIRLFGVDAPETKQSCSFKDGREYPCGMVAKDTLTAKVGQAPVACEVKNKDKYGRTVAACAAGGGRGGDLGAFMVENGWAVAYRQYSKAYVGLEESAAKAGRGMWQGSFQEPAQWRREHPRGGAPAAAVAAKPVAAPAATVASLPAGKTGPPSPDCVIKGNINSKKERIYHVPGGRSYDATDVVPAEGERWFCSEQEAVAAGWRAAKN